MSQKRSKREPITNTATKARVHETAMMAMAVGTDAILMREAQGAREVASQTERLPSRGSEDEGWAKVGVVFGKRVEGDDLFREVALPAGWKIERTDHSMWTKLVDDRGRERAMIFYKAAFYDRDANIFMKRRFQVSDDALDANKQPVFNDQGAYRTGGYVESVFRQYVVKDCGKVVYRHPATVRCPDWLTMGPTEGYAYEAAKEAAYKECEAWLAEHGFPEWKDAAMYWDVP